MRSLIKNAGVALGATGGPRRRQCILVKIERIVAVYETHLVSVDGEDFPHHRLGFFAVRAFVVSTCGFSEFQRARVRQK